MYIISLDLSNQECIVIGGGKVAERKIKALLDAGADTIILISPNCTPTIRQWIKQHHIKYKNRLYKTGDIANAFLVIAATNYRETNNIIFEEARQHNILVNCVDNPINSNFFVPSRIRRGPLSIAISTSGEAPLVAKSIRLLLEPLFSEEIGGEIKDIGALRQTLIKSHNYQALQNLNNDLLKDAIEAKIKKIIDNLVSRMKSISNQGYNK